MQKKRDKTQNEIQKKKHNKENNEGGMKQTFSFFSF